MTQREDLFAHNNTLLIEAFAIMTLDEVNRIRAHIGMPMITKDQVLTEISNHLSTLEPYDWMKETE